MCFLIEASNFTDSGLAHDWSMQKCLNDYFEQNKLLNNYSFEFYLSLGFIVLGFKQTIYLLLSE